MSGSWPGKRIRGSSAGRPVMRLMDLLGRRWVLRILWELRDSPLNFRALRAACGGISPSVMQTRLDDLRAARLVELEPQGYALSRRGRTLVPLMIALDRWAEEWVTEIPPMPT